MFTALRNTRNSKLYLMIVLATLIVAVMAFGVVPSLAAPRPTLSTLADTQMAHELFREGERVVYEQAAPSSIGSPAFYQYRIGEWSVGTVDAIGEFRQEELSLYQRSATSSIGSDAHYEYRQGEWFGE